VHCVQGTIAYGGIIMDKDNPCMDDNHEMCREPLVRMEDGTIIEETVGYDGIVGYDGTIIEDDQSWLITLNCPGNHWL
jgi:hypothetical protein